MNVSQIFSNIRAATKRVGLIRALQQFVAYALNKAFVFSRFDVIYLTRDRLVALKPEKYVGYETRIATETDLLEMKKDPAWEITDELFSGFKNGDVCLVSYVGGKRAGYTWVHTKGQPRLVPGLRISVPDDYIYNFAGYTHPDFRGAGLQPYRHNQTLNRPEWKDKKGMIGYVAATNFSSKQGQSKSGYQPLGTIRLIGFKGKFFALFSKELSQLGIRKLSS
ncbi:MAG: hypothetical protein JNL01_15915 [Bdellovibrionales bacterium]|nr:hypothetical protein [Bdellovibrionales bacterium]